MKKLKYFLPVIILMCVIFFMSHQVGDDSLKTSGLIVDILTNIFRIPDQHLDIAQFIVRKGAHFSEYALLGICFFYGFYNTQKDKPYLTSFICSVLYACSDEFHQLFVEGRAGQIKDVLIDSSGVFVGLLVVYIFMTYILKKRA